MWFGLMVVAATAAVTEDLVLPWELRDRNKNPYTLWISQSNHTHQIANANDFPFRLSLYVWQWMPKEIPFVCIRACTHFTPKTIHQSDFYKILWMFLVSFSSTIFVVVVAASLSTFYRFCFGNNNMKWEMWEPLRVCFFSLSFSYFFFFFAFPFAFATSKIKHFPQSFPFIHIETVSTKTEFKPIRSDPIQH